MFKKNEGKLDRTLRIIAGVALLAWYFLANGPMIALIGFIPLITGLMGSCPLYTILGLNTCPLKAKEEA